MVQVGIVDGAREVLALEAAPRPRGNDSATLTGVEEQEDEDEEDESASSKAGGGKAELAWWLSKGFNGEKKKVADFKPAKIAALARSAT